MIRSLSGNPLLENMITPTPKLVVESLEMPDVRTVFVGAVKDEPKKDDRVVLLLGPNSARKSELIDFLCNFFYGTDVNSLERLNIADVNFRATTPYRPIQCYIFNGTIMSLRPVIIDTPGCGENESCPEVPSIVNKWLLDNWKMRIDAIGIVFSDLHRLTSDEEDDLRKIIVELPVHVRDNIVIFITSHDGSVASEATLRRFGLSDRPKYMIRTVSLFQKPLEDKLNDEHRKRYWNQSMNEFKSFYNRLQESTPVTISGLPYIDDARYGAHYENGSSRSSTYSTGQSTVIEVKQPLPTPPPPAQKSPLQVITNNVSSQKRPIISPPPPPLSTIPKSPPPPIPKSPPPPPPPKPTANMENASIGIPLYKKPRPNTALPQNQRLETVVSSATPPPRPPTFSPPNPPSKEQNRTILTESTTTQALTNAMHEQMKYARTPSAHYDFAEFDLRTDDPTRYTRLPNENQRNSIVVGGGMGPRRQSVPDDIRHYADETTPPPVVYDIGDRYSTVAYMNQDPVYHSTRISTRSPTRTVPVRDAHRLSREDLNIIHKADSSPTDSQSDELRRMYSVRSGNSVKPTGDVTKETYVYNTAQRTYTTQGERQPRPNYSTTTDRKRWSKSSEARSETYINDPYYSGEGVVTGHGVIETRNSRTSLHSNGTAPELVHSENKYDYQQISDRQQQALEAERFSRQDTMRRSRRQSEGSQQIYIERRISPERQRKDYQTIGNYPPVISPKPQPIPSDTNIRRVPGGEVYEENRSMYDAYSQIHHRKNENYRPIGQGVQPKPQPIPQPQPPVYPRRYDEVPDSGQSGLNHYIIPNSMRGSRSPIQNVAANESNYDPYGNYAGRQPLGVTEETTTTTTTTKKEEIERRRRKREEELRKKKYEEQKNAGGNSQYDAYGSQKDYGNYNNRGANRDAEAALIEEQHRDQYSRRTVEQKRNESGYDSYGNRTGGYGRQNGNQGSQTRKVVETKKSNIGWSPSNYSNPRDCFLNLLCFVIAPLVIIAIIIVIIVFVIIQ